MDARIDIDRGVIARRARRCIERRLTEVTRPAREAARAQISELATGLIGGLTLPPGSYAWTTGVAIAQNVTLLGGPDEIWILQVAQALSMTANTRIVLAGGARAKNVFWQVSGPVMLAASADLAGVVLTKTSVTLAAGAIVHGRLLAQTNVDVDGSTVIAPPL